MIIYFFTIRKKKKNKKRKFFQGFFWTEYTLFYKVKERPTPRDAVRQATGLSPLYPSTGFAGSNPALGAFIQIGLSRVP